MVDVLYEPSLDRCLVCVSAMGSKDIEVRFRGGVCKTDFCGRHAAFIDDFSRYTVVYLLKNNSEALDRFMQFKIFTEKQFKHSLHSH